jgi:hypothetical protein
VAGQQCADASAGIDYGLEEAKRAAKKAAEDRLHEFLLRADASSDSQLRADACGVARWARRLHEHNQRLQADNARLQAKVRTWTQMGLKVERYRLQNKRLRMENELSWIEERRTLLQDEMVEMEELLQKQNRHALLEDQSSVLEEEMAEEEALLSMIRFIEQRD